MENNAEDSMTKTEAVDAENPSDSKLVAKPIGKSGYTRLVFEDGRIANFASILLSPKEMSRKRHGSR
jgi:hypothetical protein